MAKGRILAIHDDPTAKPSYRELLEDEGYQILTVQDRDAALEALRAAEYDLVIADLRNGGELEATEAIKRFNPEQEVMVVTGQGEVSRAVEAMKLGVAEYLLKPVNRDELLLVVGRVIFRLSQRAEHAKVLAENSEYQAQLTAFHKCLTFLSVRSLDRLGDLILDTLMELLQAEGGLLWLAEDGDRRLRRRARRGLALLNPGEEIFSCTPEQRRQLQAGRPLFAAQGAILLIPMEEGGELFALMRVESPVGRSTFSHKDQQVGATVATFSAAALGNLLASRSLERDLLHSGRGGVYNMAFFRDHLDKELLKAVRYGRQASLITLVIDNYRELRGRFLDREVDEAQAAVLEAVGTVLRDADILAEAGPGKFYALLPETDSWGALVTQRRIRRALQGQLILSDLRKNMPIRILLRSATCPVDGGSMKVLDQVIQNRLDELRESLYFRGRFADLPFWSAVDLLLGAKDEWTLSDSEFNTPAQFKTFTAGEGGGSYLRLGPGRLDEICAAFCREVLDAKRVRGIIYRGLADFTPLRSSLSRVSGFEQTETHLFLLGGNGRAEWDSPRIVPLHIADGRFEQNPFLLYLNENQAYACFGRRVEGELVAFHTDDFFFVESMIAKLQDLYQLQARI